MNDVSGKQCVDHATTGGKEPQEQTVGAETRDEYGSHLEIALLERHVAFLNRMSEEISLATGAHLDANSIIRALVEALDEAGGVDPNHIRREEDLVDMFYRLFVHQEARTWPRERFRA